MASQSKEQKQKMPGLLRPRPGTGTVLLSLHSDVQCKSHGQSRFPGEGKLTPSLDEGEGHACTG